MHSTTTQQLSFGLDVLSPRKPSREIKENRLTDYIRRESPAIPDDVLVDEQWGLKLAEIESQYERDLYQMLAGNSKRPVVDRKHLRGLTPDGKRWLYNGLHNASRTALPFLLNPDELINFYVGVWRAKWKRDKQIRNNFPVEFEEAIPYLIGFGENALSPHSAKITKKSRESFYQDHLEDRLNLMPSIAKRRAEYALAEPIKKPMYWDSRKNQWVGDFRTPKKITTSTGRAEYIKLILEKLNP